MSLASETRRHTWEDPVGVHDPRARKGAAQSVQSHELAGQRMLNIIGVAVAILVPMCACAFVFGPWIEWTPDGFHYLALARGLVETGSFPAERVTPHPPGFPVLLAPLMASGDLPIAGIRVLLAGGFISTCVLTFLLYRRLIGEGWAIAAAAMTGLSATLLVQSTTLLSESIYLPMSMLALLILTRWSKSGPGDFADLAWGGLAVAGAWAIRSTGILLVPVAAWTAFRGGEGTFGKRFGRAVIVTLIATAPVIAWELRQNAFAPRHGYMESLLHPREAAGETATGLALQQERLTRFGPLRMRDLAAALAPPHVGWRMLSGEWAFPAACVISVAVLVAAFHGLVRHRRPADAYLILYVALLAIWPWKEGARLMVPLVPICIGYAACAGRRVWEARDGQLSWAKRASVFATVCALAVMAWEGKWNVAGLRDRAPVSHARLADMDLIGEWLQARVEPDARVDAHAPAGSPAKLTLLGGRYLAQRDMQVSESLSVADLAKPAPDVAWRLVHRSMIPRSLPPSNRKQMTVGEFVAIKTGG